MNIIVSAFPRFPRGLARQAKSLSTVLARPRPPIPEVYHASNRSTVNKALFNANDSRTFPRYAVSVVAATFFAVTTANSFWYNHHHFDSAMKGDPMAPSHSESPTQMVRTFSRGPILFNAKRFESLRHGGLGVDQEAWRKEKIEKDSKPYA